MSKDSGLNVGMEGGSKRNRFPKPLIIQIVRSIERGAGRREIMDRYGLSRSTVCDWVREHASPRYLASQKPLGSAERRSLVRAVLEGKMTVREAKLAFKLSSTKLVEKYLREAEAEKAELHRLSTLMDKNEVRSTELSSEDAAALKKALEEAELKIKALNTLIDVAEDQYNISIRKNPGARQS